MLHGSNQRIVVCALSYVKFNRRSHEIVLVSTISWSWFINLVDIGWRFPARCVHFIQFLVTLNIAGMCVNVAASMVIFPNFANKRERCGGGRGARERGRAGGFHSGAARLMLYQYTAFTSRSSWYSLQGSRVLLDSANISNTVRPTEAPMSRKYCPTACPIYFHDVVAPLKPPHKERT